MGRIICENYLINTLLAKEAIMLSGQGNIGAEQAQAGRLLDGEGIFPRGKRAKEDAQYFSGASYQNLLCTEGVIINNATLEPGCRSFWHVHHKAGQILLVTGGFGWYREAGKAVRKFSAGDLVKVKAGVKHWLGAAKNSWLTYLAIAPVKNGTTEWLIPVTDEEYDRLT